MSGSGRSLLFLLRRCVTGRQTRLSSGIQAGGSWSSHRCCHLLQQQTRTPACRQRAFQPLSVLKLNHFGLCTKVSSSCCCILSDTDRRWHRQSFSGGKFAQDICTCFFSAGRSTMGGGVPTTASLPVRTRQEGGLHCASERSAMVLLS